MREIGSEFALEKADSGDGIHYTGEQRDFVFTFSGRTAIETVLKNAPQVSKAMLPSYCCDSMIVPFRTAGIEVIFYPVNYLNGFKCWVEIPDDVDCLLWCNYFGFAIEKPDLKDFKLRGGIVIEDITHSLLSQNQSAVDSDYVVASVRKWLPVVCGGYVAAKHNSLPLKPTTKVPEKFAKDKLEAMRGKKDYLDGDKSHPKSEFLEKYGMSNHWLAEYYSNRMIDPYSFDRINVANVTHIASVRKNNARTLYDGLRDSSLVKPLFPLEAMECPLFVPVIIENGQRDFVRKKLIENEIYCPVHWPHPDADCASNLYDIELSLVCDQRYDENDMRRMVTVINKLELEKTK